MFFQNVFPEPHWILCSRLALDDLGSSEAGNCVGALTHHPKFEKITMICEPNFHDDLTFETHRAMKLRIDKKS